MSNGTGFLAGLVVGNAGRQRAKDEARAANSRASTNSATAAIAMASSDQWRDNTYLERTKLAARILTEHELLEQLEHADGQRVPLADLESFEEAYLLNLIKTRQDPQIIEDTYGDFGRPDEMTERLERGNEKILREIAQKHQ